MWPVDVTFHSLFCFQIGVEVFSSESDFLFQVLYFFLFPCFVLCLYRQGKSFIAFWFVMYKLHFFMLHKKKYIERVEESYGLGKEGAL